MAESKEARVLPFRPRIGVKICEEKNMAMGADAKQEGLAAQPGQALPHTENYVLGLLLEMREKQALMQLTLEHLSTTTQASAAKVEQIPRMQATLDLHTELLRTHTDKLEALAALKNKFIGAAVLGGVMSSLLLFVGKLLLDSATR